MNWSIFGWTAPSNWIGSIEPVWIIVLSPLFAASAFLVALPGLYSLDATNFQFLAYCTNLQPGANTRVGVAWLAIG
jgi:hypothetical protein